MFAMGWVVSVLSVLPILSASIASNDSLAQLMLEQPSLPAVPHVIAQAPSSNTDDQDNQSITNVDLLVMIVYTLTLLLVLNQAVSSLQKRVQILVQTKAIDQQLENQSLQDAVAIKIGIKPTDRYEFEKIPETLSITIENKSEQGLVLVNWDRCALIDDFSRQSRRVIRIPPNQVISLYESQVQSAIQPKTSLQEKVTAETSLKKEEDGALKPDKPLYDISALKKKAEDKKASAEIKKKYKDFEGEAGSLTLTLWLDLTVNLEGGDRSARVKCDIEIQKMPWRDSFPFGFLKK